MPGPGRVRTFNRIAERYDTKFSKGCEEAHAAVLECARRSRVVPLQILDVGCGTGKLLELAVQEWPRAQLYGVDPAARMLEVAARRLPQAQLTPATAECLPFDDESIDLVFSTTSLGHWDCPQSGLREIHRVLRPGGSLLMAEHAPPNKAFTLLLRMMHRLPQLYGIGDMQVLLERSPLSLIDVKAVSGHFILAEAKRRFRS